MGERGTSTEYLHTTWLGGAPAGSMETHLPGRGGTAARFVTGVRNGTGGGEGGCRHVLGCGVGEGGSHWGDVRRGVSEVEGGGRGRR